jgi:S1-C subfamily serine protease/thiol-disulfide isomerase/thioredoxin
MMHQQTILAGLVVAALAIGAFFVSQTDTALAPAQSAGVAAAASPETPAKATEPSGQPYEDLQGITQRFADALGKFKEENQAVPPTKLAEQADAEPNYPMSPVAEPVGKLDAETVYTEAKPGVVIVGGLYKCTKCNHWHVQCASGFVIRADGLIVTNFHVVEGYKKMEAVGAMTSDGRVFRATAVLAASRADDLALLKVDAEHLRPLPVAADVSVGAATYCISHPVLAAGKASCFYTFTRGAVSGKFITRTGTQPVKTLAVTNDYGAGSSGGAILNEHGAVVGVVCLAISQYKQEEKERNVQMIWRLARPSCCIFDLLNTKRPKRAPGQGKEAPAANHHDEPPTEGSKPEPPGPGSVTSDLRPTDQTGVNYYRPNFIMLSETPPIKPKAEPKYKSKKPLYGVLQLGSGENNRFLIALDEPEKGEPKIYIDRNGDGDLTAGSGDWTNTTGPNLFLRNLTIDVPYTSGKIPYKFNLYRFKERFRDRLFYYRDSGREGEVVLDGKNYRVFILDDNADARFDDRQNGALFIDLNRDGILEKSTDSAEFYSLNEPFNVNGKVWEVASMSADGLHITLRPSKANVPIKAYLTPGNPAPLFTGTALDGKPVDLKSQAAKGKYLLLDFWASWCPPCRAEFPTLRRINARYQKHGLTIVGVTLDSEKDKNLAVDAAAKAKLSYPHVFDGLGWSNAVAKLYRVQSIPQTYLLDGELKIVARGLRGPMLERRLQELLGPGDAAAAEAVDKESKEKPKTKEKAKTNEKPKPK